RAATTALASPVDEVVVVLGGAAEAVQAELADLPLRTVVNPRYADGLAGSLRVGVEGLAPDSEAVVVLLGDQPLMRRDVIVALIERFRHGDVLLVVPVYAGTRGNPVLFGRALYPELCAQEGDTGARAVIRRHLGRAALVEFADATPQLDVDTWEDYEAVRALVERRDG